MGIPAHLPRMGREYPTYKNNRREVVVACSEHHIIPSAAGVIGNFSAFDGISTTLKCHIEVDVRAGAPDAG